MPLPCPAPREHAYQPPHQPAPLPPYTKKEKHDTILATVQSLQAFPLQGTAGTREGWMTKFGGDLTLKEVGGGGHCQFRVLAHELYGDSSDANMRKVRMQVASYMENHWDEYADTYNVDLNDFDKARCTDKRTYLELLKSGDVWGNSNTLKAASKCYKKSIHILSDNGGWNKHLAQMVSDEIVNGEQWPPLFIAHIYEQHYQAVEIVLTA